MNVSPVVALLDHAACLGVYPSRATLTVPQGGGSSCCGSRVQPRPRRKADRTALLQRIGRFETWSKPMQGAIREHHSINNRSEIFRVRKIAARSWYRRV
ncbi:uncharacterized protein BDW70DRAFT_131678 [Aspergillus foveolatus]|uniref:uncharacterized protein n=1 Tax=Aspergillus foveolatus TaxID=210207 RepID=UPI003CCD85A9